MKSQNNNEEIEKKLEERGIKFSRKRDPKLEKKKKALLFALVKTIPMFTLVLLVMNFFNIMFHVYKEQSGIDLTILTNESMIHIILGVGLFQVFIKYHWKKLRIDFEEYIKEVCELEDKITILTKLLISRKSMLEISLKKIELIKHFSLIPIGIFATGLLFDFSNDFKNFLPGQLTFELLVLTFVGIITITYFSVLGNAYQRYKLIREDMCTIEEELSDNI